MNITEMLNLLLEGKTIEVELNDEAAVKTLKNTLTTSKNRAQKRLKSLGLSEVLGKLEFKCTPNALQETILVQVTLNDTPCATYKVKEVVKEEDAS